MLPATDATRNGPSALPQQTGDRDAPEASDSSDDAAAHSPADSIDANLDTCLDGASLARRHQAEIWRYLRFLGCDHGQAEDVTQETFLAVLKKPPDCRDAAAVRAYLRTVARNTFLALLRKTRREAEFDLDAAEQIWADTHPRDGGDERLAALDDCLAALEGRARQAIDLAYRESKSRGDIAAALDMSEDGVKSLLRRTRDVLRQCVDRKVGESGG
ncbi:MAG: sigma-70 family RNA polymerase sigma factor [Pirellulales bacterium]